MRGGGGTCGMYTWLYACMCTRALARYTHLLVHGWQIPDVTDEGPAGHHPQQVTNHAVLGTVPESISKLWVILKDVMKKSYIRKYALKVK